MTEATTGDQTPSLPSSQLTLPWDLREWVNEALVRDWVQQEVAELNWANSQLRDHLAAHPNYRPRLLLTLLTWSYAIGLFDSAAIEDVCLTDRQWREACAEDAPSTAAIGRFRRENRGLIRWTLARVYRRAVRTRFGLGESRFPAGLSRYLDDTASTRLDLARQVDRGTSGF